MKQSPLIALLAVLMCLCPVTLTARDHGEGFSARPIDDALFERMKGRSYGDGCTLPITDLVCLNVLHVNLEGDTCQGTMVCNKAISEDLLDIFEELFKAHYPIERIVLIDEYDADDELSMEDNNSSCFNYRPVPGTTRLSKHSQGMAVDINPLYNPYVKTTGGKTSVLPKNATPYTDRTKQYPYKITRDDICCRLFLAHGFRWGGNWRTMKDYQHFER